MTQDGFFQFHQKSLLMNEVNFKTIAMKIFFFEYRRKWTLFLFICSIFIIMDSYGQSEMTVISGRLDNWIEGVSDTPEVIIYHRYKDKDYLKNNTTYKFTMVDDSFYVSIKSPEKMYYVGFRNFFSSNINIMANAKYLIESGSHIRITFDSISQMKTNNHLLNLQIELLSDINIVSNSLLYDRSSGDQHKYYFREMKEQREKADRILSLYLEYLTPFQYELIKTNYVGFIDSMLWWRMGVMAKANQIDTNRYPEIQKWMVDVYEQYYTKVEDSIIKASDTYLEAQVNYNWSIGYMNAIVKDNTDRWFTEMYENIKNRYSGTLRDRIQVVALKNFKVFLENQELIEYVDDALFLVKDKDSRDDFLSLLETVIPGTQVHHFEFNTREGIKVTLDDFKGKVVMAHFWSLGCVPCIKMTKNIHPLVDKYGDNPNVVFLSINVNSSLKHWDSGLKSNLYSHEKELLLNVGEIGTKHPLLTYYKYYGVPQLMLIDNNGHLITSNAPRARNEKEFDELESMIIDALDNE